MKGSIEVAMNTASLMFDNDFKTVIDTYYNRLVSTEEKMISVKHIRRGLTVNARTHINSALKTLNNQLLKKFTGDKLLSKS